MNIKKLLREKIKKNQFLIVAEELENLFAQDQDRQNILRSISSRINALKTEKLKGDQDAKIIEVKENKIRADLLELIDELPEEQNTKQISTPFQTSTTHSKRKSLWRYITYLGVIIGLLAGSLKIYETIKPQATIVPPSNISNNDSLSKNNPTESVIDREKKEPKKSPIIKNVSNEPTVIEPENQIKKELLSEIIIQATAVDSILLNDKKHSTKLGKKYVFQNIAQKGENKVVIWKEGKKLHSSSKEITQDSTTYLLNGDILMKKLD